MTSVFSAGVLAGNAAAALSYRRTIAAGRFSAVAHMGAGLTAVVSVFRRFSVLCSVSCRGLRILVVIQTDIRDMTADFLAGQLLDDDVFIFARHFYQAVFAIAVNFLNLLARNAGFCRNRTI